MPRRCTSSSRPACRRGSELEAGDGIIGTPLVDASARFLRPATYGDEIDIETSIDEWRRKSFVMKHVIRRGDDVLVEGREVRIFARRHPDDPARIQAVERRTPSGGWIA